MGYFDLWEEPNPQLVSGPAAFLSFNVGEPTPLRTPGWPEGSGGGSQEQAAASQWPRQPGRSGGREPPSFRAPAERPPSDSPSDPGEEASQRRGKRPGGPGGPGGSDGGGGGGGGPGRGPGRGHYHSDDDEGDDRAAGDRPRRQKYKEADKVVIGKFPDAVNFRRWREQIVDEVTAASGRPDEAFAWILEVEQKGTTYESLADSGEFLTLDTKLQAALTGQATGEIGKQLSLRKDQERKVRRMVKGRQMLWLVSEFYKTNEEAGTLHDIQDLFAVTLHGTDVEGFLTAWESVLVGLQTEQPQETLLVLFITQVRKVPDLREEVAHFERFDLEVPKDIFTRSFQICGVFAKLTLLV